MIEAGEIGGLKPTRLPGAYDIQIPSREPGRSIPVRVYKPDNGERSKGILLHAHGGGYCLGRHDASDELLKSYATTHSLTALSVGYRLAPERPWPAGPEDCVDVATYLVDHGENDPKFGSKLSFLAGESVGANLMVLTAFALMRSRPDHVLRGLILPYGNYSVVLGLPSCVGFERPVLINNQTPQNFMSAYTADLTPLYEDLRALAPSPPRGKLPPALFLCGTNDPLLDDTLLMSVKWMASGSEAVVKISPGAPHVFHVGPLDIARGSFGYEEGFIRVTRA